MKLRIRLVNYTRHLGQFSQEYELTRPVTEYKWSFKWITVNIYQYVNNSSLHAIINQQRGWHQLGIFLHLIIRIILHIIFERIFRSCNLNWHLDNISWSKCKLVKWNLSFSFFLSPLSLSANIGILVGLRFL